ncbi:hypothetical protein FOVG_17952 [Fusarium oxysporum f. sp. pisi HDV247]|uniref:Uncharacterized protein n=1 Tax=Fusarium oxysporum f. sp. pisi HDV247 TaxID=1080344 RepID=W9NKY7_FUSOX|nr:hypothetical protein FOVG_17952 [Fusarium oxysporum f. sp. pisi HDV247]
MPKMSDDTAQCSDDEPLLANKATVMSSKATKYYLAKPAHNHNKLITYVNPVLVMQMQRFGQNGNIEDTMDMLSVGFLPSRLRKDIRDFSRQKNCTPNYVFRNDNLDGYSTTCLCHEPVSSKLVGAATENCMEKYEQDESVGTIWTARLSFSMHKSSQNCYSLFSNKTLVAKWRPRKRRIDQEIQGFTLVNDTTKKVIGQLRSDSIKIICTDDLRSHCATELEDQNGYTSENSMPSAELDMMVLLTGAWIAHSEGWLTPS